MYDVRIAIRGLSASWRLTQVRAASALRALEAAEAREREEGYEPLALRAENRVDAHDVASKGVWPFSLGG